jgi:hypothetical protein
VEYILYLNRDRLRFRSPAGDVSQQEKQSGRRRDSIEEVPTAAGRIVPGCNIKALEVWQVDWTGSSALLARF